MSIEIKAPTFPESVADGTVAAWHKPVGEPVRQDELLADIETDKIVLEIVAPADGVLKEIVRQEGDTVESEEVIAIFEAGEVVEEAPAAEPTPGAASGDARLSPAARKMVAENNLDAGAIAGSGRGGLITKEDVQAYSESREAAPTHTHTPASTPASVPVTPAALPTNPSTGRIEKRVPMTRMRNRIAERLLEAKQSTAMLTTFNEVNMQPIMDLRRQYKEVFLAKHDIKLGFMGFFVKAVAEALKRFPIVNASIDGNDVVYHGYQDVGIAVSTEKGLVVPILRDTENMSIADTEKKIAEFGRKAREGKLAIEDMQGGTFTLTNGGVFGSLMSTPILNPPQSAILGMHKIQERPMAEQGQVVIRPMMYLALSYDHRLVDGKDSVQFLVTVKGLLEEPARLLLDV